VARHDLGTALRQGILIGTSISTNSPTVVEALGQTPFGAILFDMEHTALTLTGVEELIRAADTVRTPSIVRVPGIDSTINRVLDAGADGVVIPQVESAQQAQAVVDRARFAPIGRRGLGAGRGTAYGVHLADRGFTANENARVLVCVQIESQTGVDNAHEILSVPGLDAVVIGPGDLSHSLGEPMGSAKFWDAVEATFAAARAHSVAAGTFCFREDDAEKFLRRGARMLLADSDLGWMLSGAHHRWAQIQAALELLNDPHTKEKPE
jgi:2-keto-3-deoxy-L-rhamnonate aldolase RhmA